MPVINSYVSGIHLANLEAESKKAVTEADLKRVAALHTGYLTPRDLKKARELYAQRLAIVKRLEAPHHGT